MISRLFSIALLSALFWLPASSLLAGETEFAEPAPSMDTPRQILFSLNTKDDVKVNGILSNIVNVQKLYGIDNVEIVVVGWGAGVRPLLLQDSTVRARIESLMQYDVEFVACKNTLDFIDDRSEQDLIDGVDWVTAGLPEIVERRKRGWVDLWP